MGTNYRLVRPTCPCCGETPKPLHIAKSSGTIHGTFHYAEDPVTFKPVVTPVLCSWGAWKAFLIASTTGGQQAVVQDSYGATWETFAFLDMVEGRERPSRQHQWWENNDPGRIASSPTPNRVWLDRDGFSFYGGEFS